MLRGTLTRKESKMDSTLPKEAGGMSDDEMIDLGEELQAAGIPVFVIRLTQLPTKTEKVPTTKNGHLDATLDLTELADQIDSARKRHPTAVLGIGAVPGRAGYVALDFDVKNGAVGGEWLERCRATYGEDIDKVSYYSISGAINVLMKKRDVDVEIGNTSPWPDVDVRADAGWIVPPGVETPWGEWRWRSGDLFDLEDNVMPKAMAAKLSAAIKVDSSRVSGVEAEEWLDAVHGPIDGFTQMELDKWTQTIAACGNRNPTLFEALTWLRRLTHVDRRGVYVAICGAWSARMAQDGEQGRMNEPAAVLRRVVGFSKAQDIDEPEAAEDAADVMLRHMVGFAHVFPDPEPLIDGVLDLGTISILYARWGCFKSFLALDWALSVATGQDWCGYEVEKRPVVILGYEAPVSLHRRATAWGRHYRYSEIPNYHMMQAPPKLTNLKLIADLSRAIDRIGAGLVIVDTVARGGVEADMNTHEANLVFEGLHMLGGPERVVTGVGHAGKDTSRGLRGFSSQEDQVDALFRLDRERDKETQQPIGPATLSAPKAKDREPMGRMMFDLVSSPFLSSEERVLERRDVGAPDTSLDVAIRRVRKRMANPLEGEEWVSIGELKETIKNNRTNTAGVKITRSTVQDAVLRLVDLDALEMDDTGLAVRPYSDGGVGS